MRKRIEGCGFSCIDYIKTDDFTVADVGGTCANVLSILSFLGWDSAIWMPKYRERMLYNWLMERRVTVNEYIKTEKRIPRVLQLYDREKNEHFFYTRCPVCAKRLAESSVPSKKQINEQAGTADVFFCDRISEGVLECANRTVLNGGIAMYEPNGLRFYNQFLRACRNFNIVKFSKDKIPEKWKEQLRTDLRESRAKLIIMTEGKQGLQFSYRQSEKEFSNWFFLKVSDIEEGKDSSGAGDWLTAFFLYDFILHKDQPSNLFTYEKIKKSLDVAMEAAALSCKEIGAQGILHSQKCIKVMEKTFGIELPEAISFRIETREMVCPYCGNRMI